MAVALVMDAMVAPAGMPAPKTAMPMARPAVEGIAVMFALALVVVPVVETFNRLAAVPPMSSLPAATRPRRSGTLKVVLPSPAP